MDKHVELLSEKGGITSAPVPAQLFGSAGREHMERYGTPNFSHKYFHCKRTSSFNFLNDRGRKVCINLFRLMKTYLQKSKVLFKEGNWKEFSLPSSHCNSPAACYQQFPRVEKMLGIRMVCDPEKQSFCLRLSMTSFSLHLLSPLTHPFNHLGSPSSPHEQVWRGTAMETARLYQFGYNPTVFEEAQLEVLYSTWLLLTTCALLWLP